MNVHPTAIVHPSAILGDDVTIGPFCVVEENVTIGKDTVLKSQVQVGEGTVIGCGNTLYGPSTIGFPPQDLRYQGEKTKCVIGDHNVIREFVTIHRGTEHGGGKTSLGSQCLLMAYSHVAHDCTVGDHVIFANAGTLAGHVEVGEHSSIGAFCAVHQFCRVGVYAYLGGFTVATKDVLPYVKTVGARPAKAYGINTIGLERKQFDPEDIRRLKQAFRTMFMSKNLLEDAVKEVEEEFGDNDHVMTLVRFVRTTERGVVGR